MEMRYYLVFGLLAAAMAGFLYHWTYNHTDWNPYVVWLAALSATTFAVYGLDKRLSKSNSGRVPENILHLLALLGGFPGGWLGMLVFHHKTNFGKQPAIWIVLILATAGHLALAYFCFFRGS